MILPPKDFQAWRQKLDKLKQVVRVANPSELNIHTSKFTMSKRVKQPPPAAIPTTVATGQRTGETIQSDAFDLEGQAAETEDGGDDDVAGEADKNEEDENEKEEETSDAQIEDEDADTVEEEGQGQGSDTTEQVESRTESVAAETQQLQDKLKTGKQDRGDSTPGTVHEGQNEQTNGSNSGSEEGVQSLNDASQKQNTKGEAKRQSVILDKISSKNVESNTTVNEPDMITVPEESCLGYVYPKKIPNTSILQQKEEFGSKLGKNQPVKKRNRLPGASNLEKLLTCPRKITSKHGSVRGYGITDYPKSMYQEKIEQRRRDLKMTATVHQSPSPSVRHQASRYVDTEQDTLMSPMAQSPTDQEVDMVMAQEQVLNIGGQTPGDVTPTVSENQSRFNGWDGNEQERSSQGINTIQTTRVGGVTFVKNASTQETTQRGEYEIRDTSNMQTQESSIFSVNRNDQKKSQKKLQRKNKRKATESQRMIRQQRRRSSGGGYDFSNRYSGGQIVNESVNISQTPLQLANLSILMSNLEKSGSLAQANEDAFNMMQKKKRYTSLNKLQSVKGNSEIQLMHPPGGTGAKIPSQQSHQRQIAGTAVSQSNSSSIDKNRNALDDTTHSFYVTDERGNLMKVSKDTLFELTNDHQFHRMGPKLPAQLPRMEANLQVNPQKSQPDQRIQQQWHQNQAEMKGVLGSSDTATRKTQSGQEFAQAAVIPQQTQSSFSQITSANYDITQKSNSQMPFRYSHYDESSSGPQNLISQQRLHHGGQTFGQSMVIEKSTAHMQLLASQRQKTRRHKMKNPAEMQAMMVQKQAAAQGHDFEAGELMMIQGGQAPLTTKQHEKKLAMEQKVAMKANKKGTLYTIDQNSPHKTSNIDLRNIDPSLAINTPRKRAYFRRSPENANTHNKVRKSSSGDGNEESYEDEFVGEMHRQMNIQQHKIADSGRFIEAASRDVKGSPPMTIDQEPIQWQVKPSSNHPSLIYDYNNRSQGANNLAYATGSNNFTLGREPITASANPATSSADSRHRGSRGSSNNDESLRGSNLPSMLQNMKKDISNQAAMKTEISKKANYGVVGRSMSPDVQFGSRRKSKTKDASMQHNNPASSRDQGTATTAGFAANQLTSGVGITAGAKLMPIVIQKTSSTTKRIDEQGINDADAFKGQYKVNGINNQVGDYFTNQELSIEQQESLLQSSGDKLTTNPFSKHASKKEDQKKKKAGRNNSKSKSKTPIRFDEDGRTDDAGEVVTVHGDASMNMLGLKINDIKSRDRSSGRGETMNLDNPSSKGGIIGLGIHSNKSTEQLPAFATNTIKSPNAASYRSEMTQRQPIPIPRRSKNNSKDDDTVTQPASHISITLADSSQKQLASIGNLATAKQDMSGQTETERQHNADLNIAGSEKEIDLVQQQQPSNIVFSMVNNSSSEDLQLLQQLNVNLQQIGSTDGVGSKKGLKKKFNTKSNAFGKRRSTKESLKYADHKTAKQNNIRFNSTEISSVKNSGRDEHSEGEDKSQQSPSVIRDNMNSFLPKMPFKQSNFARTHKAIKMLRQGPIMDQKRHANLSGQFINLNDYAAMHGQFAPGDSRMYLRPAVGSNNEDILSGGLQSTEVGGASGVDTSKDYQLFNMTQTVQSANHQNIEDALNNVTQTSFGPVKNSSLSLTKDAEMDSETRQKGQLEGAGTMLSNPDYGESAGKKLYKNNQSTQIDVHASAPFGRRVVGNTQKRMTESLDRLGKHRDVGGYSSPHVLQPQQQISSKGTEILLQQFQGPTTAKNLHNRQLALDNQQHDGTTLLSDYIQTQRLREQHQKANSNFMSSPEHTSSPHKDGQKPHLTMPDLNAAIKEANEASLKAIMTKEKSSERQQNNTDTTPGSSQVPRQVIVHKLTTKPDSPAKQKYGSVEPRRKMQSMLALQSLPNPGSVPTSPKGLGSAVSQEGEEPGRHPSITDHTSNYAFRKSGEMLRGAIFVGGHNHPAAGRSQQFPKFNISGNATANMMTFGQFNRDPKQNYQVSQHNMTSTASKFMTNTEEKARQFIDKQRKRTATLGTKRMSNHQRKVYKVSDRQSLEAGVAGGLVPLPAAVVDLGANLHPKESSLPRHSNNQTNEEPEIVAADQIRQSTKPKSNKAMNDTGNQKFFTPPVIEFSGENLRESGMSFQGAQSNQSKPQAQYVINRKLLQQQQNPLNNTGSMSSSKGMNQGRNTSLKNQDQSGAAEVFISTLVQKQPNSPTPEQMNEDLSVFYQEYLHQQTALAEEDSKLRAKTPNLSGAAPHLIMMITKQNTGDATSQVQKNATAHIMSNDTLNVVTKSKLEPSDGGETTNQVPQLPRVGSINEQ